MEALHDVIKLGKVRYIGASSMRAWQFAKMQSAAEKHGWTKFVTMQDQYNVLQREEEREVHGLLADQGVGNMVWSPLNGGIVARPWSDKSIITRAASTPDQDQSGRPLFVDSGKTIVYAVERIAVERGVSMGQLSPWRGVLKNPSSIPRSSAPPRITTSLTLRQLSTWR